MDGLSIGDRVKVKALAVPVYLSNQHRIIERRHTSAKEAFYVGYTHRQEGELVLATDSLFRATRNYLRDIKSIKLMRIRFNERGKEHLAFRQDLAKLEKEEEKGGESDG